MQRLAGWRVDATVSWDLRPRGLLVRATLRAAFPGAEVVLDYDPSPEPWPLSLMLRTPDGTEIGPGSLAAAVELTASPERVASLRAHAVEDLVPA